MQRVAIIGSAGSGKSTFARQFGNIVDIPVFHLDVLHWNPGWIETPRDQFIAKQKAVIQKNQWIIDGNYSSTMDIRFKRVDTIIFLNFPRYICLWRAIKRNLHYRNVGREDMAPMCYERISYDFFKFLKWIWDYPSRSRLKTINKLESLKHEKKIAIFYSPFQVQSFLKQWSKNKSKLLQ